MTIVGSAIKTSNMKKMQLKKISSNPPSIKEKPAILFYSILIFKMQQKYSIQKELHVKIVYIYVIFVLEEVYRSFRICAQSHRNYITIK